MAAEISVVVPTYRRPPLLRRCLRSLAGQLPPDGSVEIVVVDDASGPPTVQVLEEESGRLPALRWASQAVNRGPAAARNRAVGMATGRWVLFVDDDIVAAPGLVAQHRAFHAAGDERLGVVGLVEWDPALEVTPFMRWLDRVDVQFDYAHMSEGPVEPPSRAFYTCNVSLSRDLFLSVGGFDERFPYPAYEDTELALRLSVAGFRLEYRPSALAWHAREVTLADFQRRMAQVGEAAVILQSVQPELASSVDLEGPQAGGWRRWARRLFVGSRLPARVPALADRYYQAAVNEAFCSGVARGRAGKPAAPV